MDGTKAVTQHQWKPVILGGRHGWKCEVCGYQEITQYYGRTPDCKGIPTEKHQISHG